MHAAHASHIKKAATMAAGKRKPNKGSVVSHADFELMHRLIDGMDCVHSVTAEIMRGMLQVVFGIV